MVEMGFLHFLAMNKDDERAARWSLAILIRNIYKKCNVYDKTMQLL
jgi:hypothetical protein